MSNTITPTVFYRTLNMEGLEIFYREAGPRDAPTVLLLHGFPASSHMFRNLIPMLRINIMSLPRLPWIWRKLSTVGQRFRLFLRTVS
jgi:pimeloyl-ACP methyl ester carboxylesterase